MADKKESKPSPSLGLIEIVVVIIFLFTAATFVISWINKNRDVWTPLLNALSFNLINFFAKFIVFSFFFSCAMLILVIIYSRKYQQIRRKVMSKILPPSGIEKTGTGENIVNPKWQRVLNDSNSDDPSKWKLAIIEADIILDELLSVLSLPGENIGDKLKAVNSSEFDHLDQAWEAHKIRNAIAHGGSDFLLTQKETKRVVELYKEVFSEFEII